MGSNKAAPTAGTASRSATTRCFLFNDHGDCVAAKLRSGNGHSADDWDELLVPEIERQQTNGRRARCGVYNCFDPGQPKWEFRLTRAGGPVVALR